MEIEASRLQSAWNEFLKDDYFEGGLLTRKDFPSDFLFGTASSAYQYEGAYKQRGKNIWDTFTHDHPEKIKNMQNGDMAVDFLNRWREDVKLMNELGVNSFRLSISWSRVLPNGIDKDNDGIKFYRDLFTELKNNDIEPFVTLFHWGVPQALETKYQGFLSHQIVDDFCNYANICFSNFGHLVNYWTTFNEPWTFCSFGYGSGTLAPGRCSPSMTDDQRASFAPHRPYITPNATYTKGNSGTEPYITAHNMLLAHAKAVKLYRNRYQVCKIKNKIGITLVSTWFEPYTNSKDPKDAQKVQNDRAAVVRALDFMYGWFMNPLVNGDYPQTMKDLVKDDRLPTFSTCESEMVKGSFDFIGLNYYTSNYAKDNSGKVYPHPSYQTDSQVTLSGVDQDDNPIGPKLSEWIYMYPKGLHDLLIYTKTRYDDPLIYITENGVNTDENILDPDRVKYHDQHMRAMLNATRIPVNVKGYFVWSLLDNFEWASGYDSRYGIYYVDYDNGLKRYSKMSNLWFKNLLQIE